MFLLGKRYFQLVMMQAARSEKIFRGLVWHHHSLKISFGLREHTVMPHYTREIIASMNPKRLILEHPKFVHMSRYE